MEVARRYRLRISLTPRELIYCCSHLLGSRLVKYFALASIRHQGLDRYAAHARKSSAPKPDPTPNFLRRKKMVIPWGGWLAESRAVQTIANALAHGVPSFHKARAKICPRGTSGSTRYSAHLDQRRTAANRRTKAYAHLRTRTSQIPSEPPDDGQAAMSSSSHVLPQMPIAETACRGNADYLPISATSGNLRALCPDCGKFMRRRVSLANLNIVGASLDIAFPQGASRIRESAIPSVNCDSSMKAHAHEHA